MSTHASASAASVEPTVDDARAIVDRSVEVVHELRALAKPRKGISRAQRNKIGERDGWKCCICGQPVDPTLVYQQRTPQEASEHAQHLGQYAAHDFEAVIAWVGRDGGRARSAFGWFHEAQAKSDLPEEAARSRLRAFHAAVMPVAQARAEHNGRTASVEHLRPVSAGGGNEMDNLAIAHRGCNTTVNPMAGNADLLDARRVANEFLDRLNRGSTNGRAQAGRLGRVCHALGSCGVRVPDHGDLACFPSALAVVHVAFADMWTARRECRIHVLGLWREANRTGAVGDRDRLR